jgi:hypothetical protein
LLGEYPVKSQALLLILEQRTAVEMPVLFDFKRTQNQVVGVEFVDNPPECGQR